MKFVLKVITIYDLRRRNDKAELKLAGSSIAWDDDVAFLFVPNPLSSS